MSRSVGERYKSLASLSAPVFGERGNVLLVVTAFGLRDTFDASWSSDIAGALRSWADEIAYPLPPPFQ